MDRWPIDKHYLWQSTRKQKWSVAEKTSGTGMRRTMTNQTYPIWNIGFQLVNLTDTEEKALHGFIALHKGNYKSFYWKDPDYHHEEKCTLVSLGNNKYQCMILYDSYSMPAPHVENLTVYGDGTEISASTYSVSDGIITFTTAPTTAAKLTATYDYLLKVVLNSSEFGTTRVFQNLVNADSIELETVL